MPSRKGVPHFGRSSFGTGGFGPCPDGYQPRILSEGTFCVRFTRQDYKGGEVWQKDGSNLILRGFFNMREHLSDHRWFGSTPGGTELRADLLREIIVSIVRVPLA